LSTLACTEALGVLKAHKAVFGPQLTEAVLAHLGTETGGTLASMAAP